MVLIKIIILVWLLLCSIASFIIAKDIWNRAQEAIRKELQDLDGSPDMDYSKKKEW